MPNDIPYLDFITGKPRRNESAPIPDAGPDEAEIDAFKASVLAKLALMVGKDGIILQEERLTSISSRLSALEIRHRELKRRREALRMNT